MNRNHSSRGRLPRRKPASSAFSAKDTQGAWFGLGMSGLIGWSVAVPTLGGIMLGVWLDRRHPGAFSWTLALLFAGLFIGCANAWYWVDQQDKAMHDE